jgi:hypothetical protein
MNVRRLAILQWVGFFLGGAVWAVQLVLGYGVAQTVCSAAGSTWGIAHDAWQVVLMGVAAACILAAEASAIGVVVRTQGVHYDADGPPLGRIRFFAIAAVVANAAFLVIVLLSGIGAIVNATCRQA